MTSEAKEGYIYIVRFSDLERINLFKVCMTEKIPYEVFKKYFGPETSIELSFWTEDIVESKRKCKSILGMRYYRADQGYDWFNITPLELVKFALHNYLDNNKILARMKIETIHGEKPDLGIYPELNSLLLFGDLFFSALVVLSKIFFPEHLEGILGTVLFDDKHYLEIPIAKCLYRLLC